MYLLLLIVPHFFRSSNSWRISESTSTPFLSYVTIPEQLTWERMQSNTKEQSTLMLGITFWEIMLRKGTSSWNTIELKIRLCISFPKLLSRIHLRATGWSWERWTCTNQISSRGLLLVSAMIWRAGVLINFTALFKWDHLCTYCKFTPMERAWAENGQSHPYFTYSLGPRPSQG